MGDSSAARHLLEFINSRINFERLPVERYELEDFKLERMRELLARLGDPQKSLPALHIAGTKGKGSTAAMAAAILSAAGYRVGLFTSPHLQSIGERMTVNGQQPTDDQLDQLLQVVPAVIEQMDRIGPSMRATFFECITAMAWEHFRRQEVDLVVLEVGLGGRLDATNVCAPLVTVITSISRDHERLLGSTLASIAGEKAGIIKPGIPVLSGVTQTEPRDVIRSTAARHESALFELDRDLFWSIAATGNDGDAVSVPDCDPLRPLTIETTSPWGEHRIRVPLPGRHQARNALLAVSACDLLSRDKFPLNDGVERGFRDLHWPLRIEVLRRDPLVIVDAAHNDGSVNCLVETLAAIRADRRVLIFATAKDKDAPGMLGRLGEHFDEVILTQFLGNPRSVSLDVLRSIAAGCLKVPFQLAASPSEAWTLACTRAGTNDLICATGSFFLAAETRAVICADEAVRPSTVSPKG